MSSFGGSPSDATFEGSHMVCNATLAAGVGAFPQASALAARVAGWIYGGPADGFFRYETKPFDSVVELPKPPCLEPLRTLARLGTGTASFFSGSGKSITVFPAWLLNSILDLDGRCASSILHTLPLRSRELDFLDKRKLAHNSSPYPLLQQRLHETSSRSQHRGQGSGRESLDRST